MAAKAPPFGMPDWGFPFLAFAPALSLGLPRGLSLSPLVVAVMGALFAALVAGGLILARRRVERETREGERRYRRLVENSLGLICTHDLNGILLSINPAAAELLGCRPEEAIGRSLRGILAPSVQHLLDDYLLRIQHERADSGYMRLVARDGTEMVWMYRNVLTEEPGKPPYVLGHAIDVTELTKARKGMEKAQVELERRVAERTAELEQANERLRDEIEERQRAEQAWRESETRLRSAFAGAAIGMALADSEGRYIEVNPAYCAITGYTAQELLAGCDFRSITHPEDLPFNLKLYEQLRSGEMPSFVFEKRYIHKGGESVWVRTSVSRLRDAQGQPADVIVLTENITRRKRLEEELLQSQKMEAIGRLAGGVAHDFNNLLTVILGYTQMLLGELRRDDPLREHAAAVLTAAERASELTHQLLAFSRRQVLQPKVVNLNAALAETERMLQRVIGEDIELVTALAPQLGRVKVDPAQIQQVILNLAINARDAMPRGGRLTIETTNAEVGEAAGIAPGRYVRMTVRDTGGGMSAETQSHLFEPFFTTKEQGKGTGLGLSTVYGIVQQSGGHLEVDSRPGQGSTFDIYLPRVEEATEEERREEPSRPARGTETILLVEDEPAVRKLTRELLSRQGYTVMEAAGGEEALRRCEESGEGIDLVLTDVILPEMSGWELAERVARLRLGIRVLYMSGYPQDTLGEQSVLRPGTAFIQKPFSGLALARTVREALEAPQERGAGA
ncbi:MAG TPA: PAS domain S-box protein [Bryobacterales bacterium]|nr:PAS domain S-box protein [Bryobacterales bacterium]